MIATLKSLMQKITQVDPVDDQAVLRMACTVLMFEVVRADFEVHENELVTIGRHIDKAFGLGRVETAQLMKDAHHKSEHAVSLHDVVAAINLEYTPEEKKPLMRMLWDVAYADGHLDKHEEHTIRKLADWLHIPHRDFIKAKHDAMEGGL